MKGLADDKITATEKLKFVLRRVENSVGKGENAGDQHFLLFPGCFHKVSSSGSLKVRICGKEFVWLVNFRCVKRLLFLYSDRFFFLKIEYNAITSLE